MTRTTPVVLLFLAFTGIAAADTAHGISKKPFAQEELAIACEKGDPNGLLNVKCEEVVKWFKIYRSELGIKDVKEMANYIRTLNIVPCPGTTPFTLNREVNGHILHEATNRWQRAFSGGENCLYDNNRGEIQFSLSCANSPYEKVPVVTAMVPPPTPVKPPVTVVPPPTTTVVTKETPGGTSVKVVLNNNINNTVSQYTPPPATKWDDPMEKYKKPGMNTGEKIVLYGGGAGLLIWGLKELAEHFSNKGPATQHCAANQVLVNGVCEGQSAATKQTF